MVLLISSITSDGTWLSNNQLSSFIFIIKYFHPSYSSIILIINICNRTDRFWSHNNHWLRLLPTALWKRCDVWKGFIDVPAAPIGVQTSQWVSLGMGGAHHGIGRTNQGGHFPARTGCSTIFPLPHHLSVWVWLRLTKVASSWPSQSLRNPSSLWSQLDRMNKPSNCGWRWSKNGCPEGTETGWEKLGLWNLSW